MTTLDGSDWAATTSHRSDCRTTWAQCWQSRRWNDCPATPHDRAQPSPAPCQFRGHLSPPDHCRRYSRLRSFLRSPRSNGTRLMPSLSTKRSTALTKLYAPGTGWPPASCGKWATPAPGHLGQILQAREQHDLAAQCYRRAHGVMPGVFSWSYYPAITQTALGQDGIALVNLRKTVQLNPHYSPAQLKVARLLLALGELEVSRKVWELLVKQNPESVEAYCGLGQVCLSMGEFDAAAECCRRACELYASFSAAHYGLGLVDRRMGQSAKSQEHMLLAERHKGRLLLFGVRTARLWPMARCDAMVWASDPRGTWPMCRGGGQVVTR